METKPIPLIQFHGEQFQITQEAVQFLSKLEGPLGVVTIVGKYRTGKSLFLNKVLLNNSESFKVCPTINSCTKGLWISRQTIKSQHPETPDMDAIVIDTEGFGAMEETDAYNNRILLFAMLLSSYFIYNSVGSIDEKSLNNLNVITNLAKELQSKNMSNDHFEEEFPTFMWVVRDFTLKLVDQNGFMIQPKQYLENALEIQKGVSDATQNKNKIRRMIKHFFKERDCFTMVTPVNNEEQLQKLNTLSEEQFRPQFMEQVKNLRGKIMRKIKPKKLKNRKLTGLTFIELANSYISAINSGSLPNLESAWRNINTFQNNQTVRKMKQSIDEELKKFTSTIRLETDFLEKEKQLLNSSLQSLKRIIHDQKDLNSSYEKVKQYLCKGFTAARQKNNRNSYNLLVQNFHSISFQFSMEMENSLQEMDKKFKQLEKQLKQKFNQNPSIYQFMSEQFYPYKTQMLTNLVSSLSQKNQSQKSNAKLTKETYQGKLRNFEEENKKISQQIFESQRQLFCVKAKLEEEQKIKSLELNYINKEVAELKDELVAVEAKNSSLLVQLKQKQIEAVQLAHKNDSYAINVRDLQDDRRYLKKEIQILNNSISFKVEEIAELKKNVMELATDLKKVSEREEGLASRTKSEIQLKSTEYEQLLIKYENSRSQIMDLHKKIAQLEAHNDSQGCQFQKERNMYEETLEILKQNFEKQFDHRNDLIEANKNMAFALKHLEQRFDQAEQKQKKLKQYKKCFKNSSCMQCHNCSKFFVPTIFPQHLNVCILGPEALKSYDNEKNLQKEQLKVLVKQTLLKDSDSKPYTEYVLEIHKDQKVWTICRKYKQLCYFHSQLKGSFPGMHFSDFSYIVNPQEGSKKSLLVEQRRKILQKYMKDLSSCPLITQTQIWREFIEDETQNMVVSQLVTSQTYMQNKLAISSLVKQNILNQIASPGKQNSSEWNGKLPNHKSPEQFLKIWNERNLRAKEFSKTKKVK